MYISTFLPLKKNKKYETHVKEYETENALF